MCGHAGIIGKGLLSTMDVARQLAIIGQVRGEDGTGIAAFTRNGEGGYIKSKNNAFFLLFGEEWPKFKKANSTADFVMVHNRAATKGEIKDANTHPFNVQHITLAHNGTLLNHHSLNFKLGIKTEVDSQAITHMVAEKGIDEAYKELDGAAALVYFNAQDNTLNIVRNEQRTLFYAPFNNGAHIIYASEQWMIDAVQRNKDWKRSGDIVSFEVDKLYTFSINSKGEIGVEGRKLAPFVGTTYHYLGSNSSFLGRSSGPVVWAYSDRQKRHVPQVKVPGWEWDPDMKEYTQAKAAQVVAIHKPTVPAVTDSAQKAFDIKGHQNYEGVDSVIPLPFVRAAVDSFKSFVAKFGKRCCICGETVDAQDWKNCGQVSNNNAACHECCGLLEAESDAV